ncbi:hypothetical protein HZY83_04215 [Gemella sp. GH3]|uniref:hypothetical protein n=1 Tax=unclassified Gemella TaxID=2624949 RepID=UPI0015D02F6E|nr:MULTISPECIES: hypothetical protein [unclassified Gemella]MBF0713885.1 hypothetical protein [Gemella sp. GH3.1]NYS50837.1 hypothetical protein [Gemella sp. GH3]
MKIIKVFKFGNRILLSLDNNLPESFRNNTKVLIDDFILEDAIISMDSENNNRKNVSVKYDGKVDLEGKELILI